MGGKRRAQCVLYECYGGHSRKSSVYKRLTLHLGR
jgi:hypothetical protein